MNSGNLTFRRGQSVEWLGLFSAAFKIKPYLKVLNTYSAVRALAKSRPEHCTAVENNYWAYILRQGGNVRAAQSKRK